MMIKCSMQGLILADMLSKCDATKDFREKFTDEEIKEALKIGDERIRQRKWFEDKKYSEEFLNLTKYLKLFTIANKELSVNNLVYRYKSDSELGVLIGTIDSGEVEIGIVSKAELFASVVKGYVVMLDNVNEIDHVHEVTDDLRKALLQIKPQMTLSYTKDNNILDMAVIREFEGKILEEDLVTNKIKSVNSKYLRDKLLGFLEVGYE